MKLINTLIAIMAYAIMTYSTPTWMWMGMYNCDNNTHCGPNLTWAGHEKNMFFSGANDNHPTGPVPYGHVDIGGYSVTISALTANYQRENCDFLYIAGHGQIGNVGIWDNNLTYCFDYTPQYMNFGEQYGGTRWVYLLSCEVLQYWNRNDFWSYWDQAFKGVQCILGFASTAVCGGGQGDAGYNFWQRWTGYNNDGIHPIETITWAHFHSQEQYVYQYGAVNPNTFDVAPAILGTFSNSDYHCYMNDTYFTATSEQGYPQAWTYYYIVYGNPQMN